MDLQDLSKDQLLEKIESLQRQIDEISGDVIPNQIEEKDENPISALFNNIPEPVWGVDGDFRIIAQNSAFNKTFKDIYGIEFSTGDSFIRYTPVDLQTLWSGFFGRALRGENFSAEQEFHIHENPVYYEFVFSPMETADGSIYGVAILGREITERKQSELKTQESEKRFRSLVQNSNDIIFVLTGEGLIRYTSPSVESILGYSTGDITDTDIFTYIHPEDQDTVQKHIETATKGTDTTRAFRCRFRRADGSFAFIEGLGSNHSDDEYIRGIVVNARDASDRVGIEEALQESERRFKSIIEDLPRMICRFLPDGTLTFVNGNYCNAMKRNAGELLGKSFLKMVPEDERESIQERIRQMTRTKPVLSYEHSIQLPNGDIRRQAWTSRAILDHEGDVVEYQAFGEDITDPVK